MANFIKIKGKWYDADKIKEAEKPIQPEPVSEPIKEKAKKTNKEAAN